ncbi:MAG TPA: DUF5666 domain-containing protein [Chloroflexia bacterium]|nr:DUF5666 domain-containing protein [Chloroflexia bacterium]
MKQRNGILATGAVATLAAFGLLVGVAGAQGTPPTPTRGQVADTSPHPVHIAGQVEKVDATAKSLTLKTPKSSITVNVSDNTWVLVEKDGKCAEGALADIKAGQPAMVGGMTTATEGQINARTVAQGCAAGKQPGRPGGPGGVGPGKMGGKLGAIAEHVAMGNIKSISGNTIIVTSERGDEVTITTTADTVVLNGGFKDASSLKVGDKIQVLGKPAGMPDKPAGGAPGQKPNPGNKPAEKQARNIEAWGLRVVTDASKLVVGRVEKVDGNTLTLKGKQTDGITVTLDGSTGYRAANVMDRKVTLTGAVQADIKVGSVVLVEGASAADAKNITADAVVIMPTAKGDKVKP